MATSIINTILIDLDKRIAIVEKIRNESEIKDYASTRVWYDGYIQALKNLKSFYGSQDRELKH